MRKSGDWMTIWDDRILEYIQAEEGASVGELEKSGFVRVSNAHISRRCKKLAEHGLLRPLGNGVYVITDRGIAYLAGDLDAAEDAPDEPVNSSGETSTGNGSESA